MSSSAIVHICVVVTWTRICIRTAQRVTVTRMRAFPWTILISRTHGDAMDATTRIVMARGGGGDGEAGGRWRWEQMRTTPDPAR